ncbi:hypothetical protein [Prevotella sp. OH937_COT-195]|uniref:hypothetical protein n=1 Tax=Prevotella sp. OH937_COT-195 TaxID=2491051 RepID=UPI000F64A4CE|nr:hypothetical protein [Prevotella sp. OH937_COT-195]RRD02694.1 hypothetical protein EII32_01400 [Prevotella sp. OH937_COT-195]
MRKRIFSILIAFVATMCMQTIMAQPKTIKVRFRGSSPNINDFVTSYARADTGNRDFATFAEEVVKGTHGYAYTKIVSDKKNGYASFEMESGKDNSVNKLEMCYWNCADKKTKIVAVNVLSLYGESIDECIITFYRYDNATRVMKKIKAPFDRKVRPVDFTNKDRTRPSRIEAAKTVRNEDANAWAPIFTLPQNGKDIEITIADGSQLTLSERQWIKYKWNGNGFRLTIVE